MSTPDQGQGGPPLPLPSTDSGSPIPGMPGGGPPPGQPDGGAQDLVNNLVNPQPQGRQINSLAGLMGVDAANMDPRSAPPPPGGGGGRFEMDLDEMREVKRQWEAVKEKLAPMRFDARQLGTVTGPGNEQASFDHQGVAVSSGQAYAQWLEGINSYVEKYVTELDRAINDMEQTDQASAADAERQY